ncbi:MAG: glycosyltransferase family 39 protein [Bacteroidetes bacterium]|nr:glycosyltransferase family 39 protein [Bacteroidota bacterium]
MNYNSLKENAFFIFLLLLATLLRLIPLPEYQFSHDELSALSRTIFPDLGQTIRYGAQYTDTHPILVQVFLYYWVKLVGYSEIGIKLPFIFCGLLSVIVSYRFAKRWFGKQAALFAQLITACSFVFIIYSSYARMYAPGVLFSMLVVSYLFRIAFDEQVPKKVYAWFGLFCLLSALNNHLNALFAMTCALAGLFLAIRVKRLWPYLLTCVAVVLVYLPHLPVTLTQFQLGGLGVADNGWLPPPKPGVLVDFMRVLFGTGKAGLAMLMLLAVVVLFSFRSKVRISGRQWLLLFLFAVNYLVIHLYSIYKSPVLQYSVLLFPGTCLLWFMASFYRALPKTLFYLFMGVSLVLLLFQGIVQKHELREAHYQAYETMVKQSLQQGNDHGDSCVTSIFAAEQFFITAYELKYKTPLSYKLTTDTALADVQHIRHYISHLPAVKQHMVLGDPDPLLIALCRERFPYLHDHVQGYFYNALTLSSATPAKEMQSDQSLLKSWELLHKASPFTMESRIQPAPDGICKVDSMAGEFPLTFKAKFSDLGTRHGQWLLADVEFDADSLPLADDIVCVSVNTADSTKNYFTAAKFADFKTGQSHNRLYLQVFIGSDSDEWRRSGEFACYIWKRSKAVLRIRHFRLQQIDYNPDKWRLWE